MSTTTTPASDGMAGHTHSHISHNGYTQSRSHHRKAAPERIPVLHNTQGPAGSIASPFDLTHNNGPSASLEEAHWHRKSIDKPNGGPRGPNGYPSAGYPSSIPPNTMAESQAHFSQGVPQTTRSSSSSKARYLDNFTQNALDIPMVAGAQHTGSLGSSSTTSTASTASTSILVVLPFVLSSLVLTSQLAPLNPGNEDEGNLTLGSNSEPITTRSSSRFLSFLGVCSLTASTLVLVGFIGEILGPTKSKSNSRSEAKPSSEELISIGTIRRILGRILSVGLPFYATSKLGGERVAIVILVALGAELMSTNPRVEEISRPGGWSRVILSRKWTVAALALQCICDLFNLTNNSLPLQTSSGYLALAVSVLLLPWPYPTAASRSSMINSPVADRSSKGASVMVPLQTPSAPSVAGISSMRSPMISTARDTDLTVASGVLATIISFVVFVLSSPQTQTLTFGLLIGGSLVAIASASSLLFANPKAMTSHRGLNLAIGLGFSIVLQELIDSHPLLPILFQSGLILISWLGVYVDTNSQSHHHDHHTHGSHSHSHSHDAVTSKFTSTLLQLTEDWPLLHSILLEKDSRRILYFMSLNFAFMLIQTFYGWATGSLGLLSDSIHMFFDCAALVVGLGAAVLSKRPPSLRFPYGFEKMDTLAGFANGIFLMLISVEIIYEALERLIEGSHMQRIGELLIVSVLGLAVNLVGMLAFGHAHHGHGHSHSHGGHDHSHHHGGNHSDHHHHSHAHSQNQNPSPLPIATPTTPSISVSDTHSHSHTHGHGHDHHHHSHHHGHSHGHENMEGIFLHVLADTLGSVAVVISTVLVHFTGWVGWDPIASCLIAVLIFASAIPLVRSCAKNLLLIVPEETEFDLREALAGVGGLRGVTNVCAPKFWVGSGDKAQVEGVMHVIAGKGAELDDVRERASTYLLEKGMNVLVQVEREGEGRCWCGGMTKTL